MTFWDTEMERIHSLTLIGSSAPKVSDMKKIHNFMDSFALFVPFNKCTGYAFVITTILPNVSTSFLIRSASLKLVLLWSNATVYIN